MLSGVLTHSRTGGGGSPEGGELSLAQYLGKLGHTLVSDPIPSETASEGQRGDGERAGVSWGVNTQAHT